MTPQCPRPGKGDMLALRIKPRRIQRSRAKGWRMPPNTAIVSRPTLWGNPFRKTSDGWPMVPEIAVASYRRMLTLHGAIVHERLRNGRKQIAMVTVEDIRRALRGKHLACWCPLDQPCHADVLLEIANA